MWFAKRYNPTVKSCTSALIGSSVLFVLVTLPALALEDGWYKAKTATGECSEALKEAVLAIQSDKPLSISAGGQSAAIIDPVKIDQKPHRMKATGDRGSGTIEFLVNKDKSIAIKVVDGAECKGAKIIFAR